MKMRGNKTHPLRGTALLLALLVILAISFVLGGWAITLASRIAFSEEMETAQKRRIALLNATSVEKQWARRSLAIGSSVPTTVVLSNDWGRFRALNFVTNMMTTSVVDSRINHFTPMQIGGFSISVTNEVSGLGETNARVLFFRSRSPVLGGYPLVAHTNANTSWARDFSAAVVSPPLPALMFGQPSSVAAAPAAPAYNSFTNRTVVTSQGGSTRASILNQPWTPLTSGSLGTNVAFNGTIAPQLPRTFTVANLQAALDEAYAGAPGVSLLGNFLVLGNTTGYPILTAANSSVATALGDHASQGNPAAFRLAIVTALNPLRRYLIVDQIPNSTMRVNGDQIIFTHSDGAIYTIFIGDENWLNIMRNSNGSTATLTGTNQFLLILGTLGQNPASQDKPSTSAVLTDGGQGRLFAFPIVQNEMIVLRPDPSGVGSTVWFNGPTGVANTRPLGVAIVNRDAVNVPGGIYFAIMSSLADPADPMIFPVAEAMQAAFNAGNQLRYRTTVAAAPPGTGRFPIVAFNTGAIRSVTNSCVALAPGAERFLVLQQGGNPNAANPNLVHISQQDDVGGQYEWRKVLIVRSASGVINVRSPASAHTFSFLSQDPLAITVADQNNARPLVLSIDGRPGVATTATRFVGGGGRTWNMTATFMNTPVTFESGGNLTLQGGIRTNRELLVAGGGSPVVTLTNSPTPTLLDLYADRVGWVESWFLD